MLSLLLMLLGIVSDPTMGLPPCEWEDSNGCYWNAQEMGNGEGQSFTALHDGTVIYW